MLPKITELEFNTQENETDLPPLGKSFLYDFDKGDFVIRNGKMVAIHGLETLKQWIIKVLKTERFRFRIYKDENYGATLDDLIGSSLPRAFIEAEIKREVTAALLEHTHIQEVQEWQFERDGKWMRIKFRVVTVEGAFDMDEQLKGVAA
ncbi:DUF2634 domain-containing protein [Lysinibacillus fusiformis]|uniref:DUF2634 domain-containing protein n=1 Tax=Lysinibacillus fusiformis TaxID=28031 RepID=UPI000D36A265|nr:MULTISPECIES: DUF2634 domain-containing protein [Lysinibacillus]MED4668080.1 DUF2634 domain-containing protein [Lysinibacillus fusiformis]QAS58490.1 hypothetical protein LSP_20280 [Lysinibacillus sphaericus]RDV35512.1 hypothetical protein C7B90_02835 [Lysinibacillus fusiformis]GED64356.1 hypothetical protein LFU01_28080 [Lysinibacillus fusiformis]